MNGMDECDKAVVAQWLECWTADHKYAGSRPSLGSLIFAAASAWKAMVNYYTKLPSHFSKLAVRNSIVLSILLVLQVLVKLMAWMNVTRR